MWPLKSHRKPYPVSRPPHLLAILGNGDGREVVTQFAADQRWQLSLADTIEEGYLLFRANAGVAIVLLDRDLSIGDWRSTVRDFAGEQSHPGVILVSAVIDSYLFGEVVRQGGFDVIGKPMQAEELRRTALLALKFRERRWREQANG